MSSRASVARSLEFQIEQRRRTVAQLQTLIADFDRQAGDLDRYVRIDEDRANNHDPSHFAYPTYAKAAIQRRENLMRSSVDLKTQLDAAMKAFDEAVEGLRVIRMQEAKERIEQLSGSVEAYSSDLDSQQHHAALI